ncbi:MAG: hypothetical protein EAX89_01610 [Candidatus Lokiarchaeota archaeon]|nr:hypothetical protein [Candidatus Lokiarchaeota archaeon]
MAESYKEIEVSCPICEIVKNIQIPQSILTQKRFGIIKIQVPQGGVCKEHQFIVFINSKGNIMGYETIDLLMKAESPPKENVEILNLNYFIRNFGLYGILSLIHAKIFNYQIYLLRIKRDEKFLALINRILDNLIPEIYREANKVIFLDESDYDNIRLKGNAALIMDSHQNILQTPWDQKLKLKFEENLIEKALEFFDEKEQFLILKRGIKKLIKEAEYAKNALEKVKIIYEDDLIDQLSQDLMEPRINRYRLLLLKEFINRRFSKKLSDEIKSKVEDFLALL